MFNHETSGIKMLLTSPLSQQHLLSKANEPLSDEVFRKLISKCLALTQVKAVSPSITHTTQFFSEAVSRGCGQRSKVACFLPSGLKQTTFLKTVL